MNKIRQKKVINSFNDVFFRLVLNENFSSSVDDRIFLDKVKSENPNELTKYVNIVKNKGLEVAMNKYKEIDPVILRQNKELELRKKEEDNIIKKRIKDTHLLINKFVNFLPNDLKQKIDRYMEKSGEAIDSTFYFLLGIYMEDFERRYGVELPPLPSDGLPKLKPDHYNDDYFWNAIDKKYGRHTIEW